MARWHINDKGKPGLCSVNPSNPKSKGCPFGGDDHHYASQEIAQKAYELSMVSSTMGSLKKKTPLEGDNPSL